MFTRVQQFVIAALSVLVLTASGAAQNLAVRGETVYTMAGDAIDNGVVIVRDGRIVAVGAGLDVPPGMRVLEAKVVTPGLIDAHSTLGLTGMLNQAQDQDQYDRSKPIQPELRAIDAYNAQDELVEWVRSFGVTTVHTGHAPGELMTGQTIVVKTIGNTVEDALVRDSVAVAATLASSARKSSGKSPGTRGKMLAMLRQQLIKAQEYKDKLEGGDEAQAEDEDASENGDDKPAKGPARDLRLETLVKVLDGEMALLVTADRSQDIAGALRLKEEFGLRLWLDSAAEAHVMIDQIRAASVPVIVHPTMARAFGDRENMSMETAGRLADAGVDVYMQSGFESYVPKVRVVLFEAAIAASYGLGFERTLRAITIDAARLLEIDDRVGSIEVGKDGDLALYDGDPFEYTTHCIATIIDGVVVSEGAN